MQARYTRLFTDESGASRFEDSTIELQQMFPRHEAADCGRGVHARRVLAKLDRLPAISI